MARNKQLRQLVELFRVETSNNVRLEAGVDATEGIKRLLARWQETLYDMHDWPFLTVKPLVTLQSLGRFYDFPLGMTLENIQDIVSLHQGAVYDVVRGIGPAEYARKDPSIPDTGDPVQRWDVQFTGTKEQIEVWPVPSVGGALMITGKRDLKPLVSEEDTADLDDQLIALHAAADYLQSKDDASWQAKANQAARRLATLTSKSRVDRPNTNTAKGRPTAPATYPHTYDPYRDDYDDDLYENPA